MSMSRLEDMNPATPFHEFICDGCGQRMGRHWLYRPDRFADVRPDGDGRKPNGRFYCNRSQTSWAGSYHQRQLRRTMAPGYA